MNKKGGEIKTLFGIELDSKAQRAIWDSIAQKHGLAAGEYFDLSKGGYGCNEAEGVLKRKRGC